MITFIAALALSVPASAGLEQAAVLSEGEFRAAVIAPASMPRFARALDSEDSLIALLSDRDASVRAQAARSLKNYALNSYRSENALLDRARDGDEQESVRREAVKSLAWAAQHWGTRDALIALAQDQSQTTTLRAISYKALYAVGSDWTAQRALTDALDGGQPLALRCAAAWALFGAAPGSQDIRQKLVDLVNDDGQPLLLRLEAAKSLYSAMTDWNLRDAVLKVAQDESAPIQLRETSILLLNAINNDWNVKEFLQKEAQEEPRGALRTAAIKALSTGPDFELAVYFHLSYYLGRFIDPLESQ